MDFKDLIIGITKDILYFTILFGGYLMTCIGIIQLIGDIDSLPYIVGIITLVFALIGYSRLISIPNRG